MVLGANSVAVTPLYGMPENQKYMHRKKVMQTYRINKLLFIIENVIDRKKFTKKINGGGQFSGRQFS